MTQSSSSDEHYSIEAIKIVEHLQQSNVPIRIMAGCAVQIHCPKTSQLHRTKLQRTVRDIDLVALKKDSKQLGAQLEQLGYTPEVAKFELDRDIYENPSKKITLDIFFDRLNMCHIIELADRLENDYPTITLADLVLQKLQIVEINERDVKDILVLFLEHQVGDNDKETIDGRYIAKLLSKDWGFYYTVTENIKKSNRITLDRYKDLLSPEELRIFQERTDQLLSMIESETKTFAWKMRQKVGTRKIWYNEVEEKERGTLAEYLTKKRAEEGTGTEN